MLWRGIVWLFLALIVCLILPVAKNGRAYSHHVAAEFDGKLVVVAHAHADDGKMLVAGKI